MKSACCSIITTTCCYYPAAGSGSVLQSTFLLLLCPAPPSCLELDQVLKAAIWVVQLVAKAVVSVSQVSKELLLLAHS